MEWQTLLERIATQSPPELLNEVKNANDLTNKVELCYNNDLIKSSLKDWLLNCLSKPTASKNADISVQYRQRGNTYCEENKHYSALKCYNKSLCYSATNSEERRTAYGNRAYVLMQIDCFEEAIKDVDRALEGDTSVTRKMKLLKRKGEALISLKKYGEAVKTLSEELAVIRGLNDDFKRQGQKMLPQVEKLLKIAKDKVQCNITESSDSSIEHQQKEFKPPNFAEFFENPGFRSASISLSLQQNDTKGRYIIAKEDIKLGEILFKEKPFTFVILPDMIDKYCTYCCKHIFAPIPCDTCPLAFFCDERCRDEAVKSFHSWECAGMEMCFSIGIVHLSLRVALLGLLDNNTDKYLDVKNLVSHINDMQDIDLFSYVITAALLVMYLEDFTDIFLIEHRNEKLLNFGGTILLHIAQLICNGHAISDIESEDTGADSPLLIEEQVRVATAIYPAASMMNHSCEPNIINSFFQDLLIVRASKDIMKGDEVFNCYGPLVYNTEFSRRQEILQSQYFFVCDCKACAKKADPITDRLRCKYCSHILKIDMNPCENCLNSIGLTELNKDLNESDCFYSEGLAKLERGQFQEACPYLLNSLLLREKHCDDTHRKLLESRDALARAYSSTDHEEQAYTHLIKNVSSIEHIYGTVSIELGQEIMKILSVATSLCHKNKKLTLKQKKILKECISYGEKGLFLFKLSYGDWHNRFHEMKKHLDYLKFFINLSV